MFEVTPVFDDPAEFTRQHRTRMPGNAVGSDLDSVLDSSWLGWTRADRTYVPGKGGWHGFVYARNASRGEAWGITVVRQSDVRAFARDPARGRRHVLAHNVDQTFAGDTYGNLVSFLGADQSPARWAALRAMLVAEVPPRVADPVRFLAAMGGMGPWIAQVQAEAVRKGRSLPPG